MTHRFKWNDDDRERPIGPEAGFKDYVRLRKSQGFNAAAIIAAFPNWANDSAPWEVWLDRAADLVPDASYQAEWFDPRTGQWSKAGNGQMRANQWGWIMVPNFPSADDWGLKLTASSNQR